MKPKRQPFKKQSAQEISPSIFEETVKQFITFEINIIYTGTGISKEGLSKLFLNFSKLAQNAE